MSQNPIKAQHGRILQIKIQGENTNLQLLENKNEKKNLKRPKTYLNLLKGCKLV